MSVLYNEIDPYAAAWLRNLVSRGLIADGDVAECSIADLRPSDLRGYRQVHFFAGIGVWSHALRRAGWPDDRNIWSASCPCQPFSDAGKGAGFDDERHLWPHLHWLVEQCRPDVVVGEQVASKDGLGWLDLVQADLEGANYTSAAVDMCSAGFGAPHIRQRLYWVAYAEVRGKSGGLRERRSTEWPEGALGGCRTASQLADANGGDSCDIDLQRSGQHGQRPEDGGPVRGAAFGIGHNTGSELDRSGPTNGFWRDADWLLCRDGKWRPVEPGTFPLAHGAASRVGRLRAYGNAINAEQATEFCAAVAEVLA